MSRRSRLRKPRDWSEHPSFWLTLWLDRPVRVTTDAGVGILVGLECAGKKKVPTPDKIEWVLVARPWRVVEKMKPRHVNKGSDEDGLAFSNQERGFVFAAEDHKAKVGEKVDMRERVVIWDGKGNQLKVIEKKKPKKDGNT